MAQAVPERFDNGVAVLIATGPSLTPEQIEHVRTHRDAIDAVMGVNDAYRICDFLDLLYAADGRWIEHHRDTLRNLSFDKWTALDKRYDFSPEWNEIKVISDHKRGLSTDREELIGGCHSGYQLINLAYLMGFRTVILLGYDATRGGQHFFGLHPTTALQVKSNYARWMIRYKNMADDAERLGLTIINATASSAIPYFEKRPIEEVLT